MKPVLLACAALLALAASGCTGLTGLPEGSAEFGDTVTVRYSIVDAQGNTVRTARTATFVLGDDASGLGLGFERSLRGHMSGDNITYEMPEVGTVQVARELQGIAQVQTAPRRDYEANVGPAAVGQTFAAFGIYTATVTGVTASQVNFTITAEPHQRDPVESVGAFLVSEADGKTIHRTLEPDVGKRFTIQPNPSGGSTPLGLAPGEYETAGATASKIQYRYAYRGDLDGDETLTVQASILRLVPGDHDAEPVCDKDGDDCNYAVRPTTPYLNGDPESVLGTTGSDDGH